MKVERFLLLFFMAGLAVGCQQQDKAVTPAASAEGSPSTASVTGTVSYLDDGIRAERHSLTVRDRSGY